MYTCLILADVNHKTINGEGQRPIHFAAKYDATQAFDLLMALGANPLERDDNNRTPFFLAAESGKMIILFLIC